MKKTVHHRTGTITLEDSIYRFVIKEGIEMELKDAEELVKIGTGMTAGLRVGALVDSRATYTDTNEARAYFASETANRQFIAVAMVTTTLAMRLIGNYYIQSNKPNTPTRLFDNEDDAVKWLREMLAK